MVLWRGSISGGLSTDFYGSSVGVLSAEDIAPFQVAIGGRQYLMDLLTYSRTILDSQAPQTDDSARPGEQSLSRAGFWVRQQTDWSEGAGQEIFDTEDSSQRRFMSSRGVEVFERRRLSLLHDTALRLASAETNLDVFSVGGFLYVVDGAHLRFTTDPDVVSPSFTSVDHTNDIIGWTTDGARIYTVFGGANTPRVATVGSGSAPAAFGTTTPDIIGYTNGRLVAADGATLYELDATGAKVAGDIVVDPRANFAWVDIVGSPAGIYVAGNAGDVAEIYHMTIDDTSTALTAPRYAGGLPYGEQIRCLASYPPAQVILIGTDRGFRVAALGQAGTLNIGERIDIDGGVNAIEARDRFAWFTWSDARVDTTGLGRVDLSIGTSELTFVPAYAEDLQTPVDDEIQGTVTGVASLQQSAGARDRRYFVVSGIGLFGERDTLVEQGSLETGHVRFGILPDKVFTSLEIRHDNTNASIGVAATVDDGSATFLGGGSTSGTTKTNLSAGNRAGLSMSLALMLTRSELDDTVGPVVRSWALTALPRPKRVIEHVVPLVLHTEITDLRKNPRNFDPLAEVRHLERLASSAELVTLQIGADTRRARVASVAIIDGGVRSWQRNDSPWLEATVLVRLLEKEF